MTLSEIPSDVRQLIDWGLSGVRGVLEAVPRVLGEVLGSAGRSVRDAVAPMLPALSHGQRDVLVAVAIVVGGGVAVFLVVETLQLLVPRNRATTRLRQRHR